MLLLARTLALLSAVAAADAGRGAKVSVDPLAIIDQIGFPSGKKVTLDAENKTLLDVIARLLVQNPQLERLGVRGHAGRDERDPAGFAQKRAEAVCDYLVAAGVARNRLQAISLGTDPEPPEVGLAIGKQNRRVDFRILRPEQRRF